MGRQYVVVERHISSGTFTGNTYGPFKDWEEARVQAHEWNKGTTKYAYAAILVIPPDRYTHPGA